MAKNEHHGAYVLAEGSKKGLTSQNYFMLENRDFLRKICGEEGCREQAAPLKIFLLSISSSPTL